MGKLLRTLIFGAGLGLGVLSGCGPKNLVVTEDKCLEERAEEYSAKIQECLEEEAKYTLLMLGYDGGLITAPLRYTENDWNIVYAYHEGNPTFPKLDEIKEDINFILEMAVPLCTDFDPQKVEMGLPKAKTKISKNKVDIKFNFPFILNDSKTKVDKSYSYSLDVRLGYIHQSVSKIVKDEIATGMVDIFLLDSLDLSVTIYGVEESTIIYILEDKKSLIDNQPYYFIFANKFLPQPEGVELTEEDLILNEDDLELLLK